MRSVSCLLEYERVCNSLYWQVLQVKEHQLKGKRIDVKRAKPSKDVNRKVFVGGIDPELTEDEIIHYFSQYGIVCLHHPTTPLPSGAPCYAGPLSSLPSPLPV